MKKSRVLFICVHNSARSQMAAALVNEKCRDDFEAESAGLEPGTLNPVVVQVLRERGIDISQNVTRAVFDVWRSGRLFNYVITVCSEADATGCPIFPGPATRLHWPFEDPSRFEGTQEDKLENTRAVCAVIEAKIDEWCAERCGSVQ